ncbi:MAG: trypsin-like peptidase domain-containing protein [Anaerolineales bacterium]|uniref:S1C family serine protease n=1 Tax=Candidatus Villigracilis proximus TaxID=3140683 RepID=UPI0031353AA8|nr:trypsin-like peptidase domain-containing protein [Anaerolineales bacterium]MBK8822635.1 trypsin-like peptidase domain-containing protein [Anaerolineales bacterium]MBK9206787.1 trypsin-like peptidase domain-containing protein [Anaerolineales bacterium]
MKTKQSFLAFVVLILAMLACQSPTLPGQQTSAQPTVIAPVEAVAPIESNAVNPAVEQGGLVALYENVNPGTVAIITDQGQGSGFVYDAQGHIVTNFHVIEGATTIEVRFTSGYVTYGTVIGTDLDSDLAIIKVDAPAAELHPLPLGDSDSLKVGQTVIAIGNPFGLNSTMTVGIISALGRTLASAHEAPGGRPFTAGDIIQTDAAINPGNSGGPLFNINGEVVGVNSAIRTNSVTETGQPANSGIGFAISINIVKRVAPSLIAEGKYDYPYLGIASIDSLSLEMVEALGLSAYTGAYVTDVVSGGPADVAGIKAGTTPSGVPSLLAGGDLITAIDGRVIRTFDELLAYLITNKGPGDTVVLTVQRGAETLDINVELGKRP